MRELIALAIGLVVTFVALMVGAGITSQTFTTVNNSSPSTLLTTAFTNITTAFTTFTGFLPVVVIAAVGGFAIMYLMRAFFAPRI